jgi:hypothetical protein
VIAVELLLSASQAFLVGVLLYLAVGMWADRGVGVGSSAAVLLLLALGVGAAWLYWLLGGVGWPLAAVAAAAATFLGALLLLTWFGEDVHVAGAPLLLAFASALYGVAGGAFLDSPRRWRWDQRKKLRAGTSVPRLSETTQAVVAQVPRSLPRRQRQSEPLSELAARIGARPPTAAPDELATHDAREAIPAPATEPEGRETDPGATGPEPELTEAPDVAGKPLEVPDVPEPVLPTERRRAAAASTSTRTQTDIELPTMIEPRAQRSPWAWAAPPEWNRDEDDEAPARRSSKGS